MELKADVIEPGNIVFVKGNQGSVYKGEIIGVRTEKFIGKHQASFYHIKPLCRDNQSVWVNPREIFLTAEEAFK